jgi:hypothetical protein
MTDPYDPLIDPLIEISVRDGVRVSPLFRVFATPQPLPFNWRVMSTNLQGDPEEPVHSVHKDLAEALKEAEKQNQLFAGQKVSGISFKGIPPSFSEMLMGPLLERVDKVLGKHNQKPKRRTL